MVLPRRLAIINRSVTNRVLGSIPRRWSPFTIVHHVGRQTGTRYATLLAAFPTGDGFILTPTYGPDADWVRNVMASGSFSLDRRGETHSVSATRLITRGEAWPYLPWLIRLAMRLLRVQWYVRADL